MEPFYLFDIRAVTSNKNIERIISPMAAQLCHLMIAAAWDGMNNEHLADVEKAAEELAKATEELACVARRATEESKDKLLTGEMGPAAESLLASGKSVLLAAQKCHIQPDVQSHQEDLLESAKGVLLVTVKILQLEDDAAVRRVIQAARWLQECLTALAVAGDIAALLAAFRDVSESLLLLNNLTERRIQELRYSPAREHLAQMMQTLRKCVPMLHTAKQSHLKHPRDLQVNGSKTYIYSLMDRTIKELTSLLANTTRNQDLWERNGFFSRDLSQLLGLLSSPNPVLPAEGEFSVLVESVVFHCMLLANSSRPRVKLQLIKHCHHLLALWKSISSHGSLMTALPARSQLECILEEKCHAMRAEVASLDRTALTAVLCQIVDTFTDAKEPLSRLMEAALGPTIMLCSPTGKSGFLRTLQPFITAFFSHAHQMLKVSRFVLARCTNIKIIKEIEAHVDSLNRLLATLSLLLTEMSKDPNAIFILEQLQSFCQRWAWTTESLLGYVDETINLPEFLDLSIQEMDDHREHCEKELENQNSGRFSWHATHLTSQAARVVQATKRYVDKVRDPIFKNGLLVLLKQLEISILEVRTATSHCLEGISCLQTRKALSKRVKHLIESTRNVREGLNASNHPDILSPLREQIRNMDVPKELDCFSAPEHLELRAPDVLKRSPMENTKLVEELLSKRLPSATRPREMLPTAGDLPLGRVGLHPVINELITATKKGDMTAVNAACSGLLELSNCCADAAQEAVSIVQSPLVEKLAHGRKMVLLTPCLISIARETAPNPVSRVDRLLQTAALLSERIWETKHCLAAVAGPWYCLVQQLFCTVAPVDFQKSKETLDEIMQTLATLVQLAGDVACTDCDEFMTVPKIQERFVRVQAKLTSAQTNTKHLLEKALSSDSCHSRQACLEGTCLLWSVSIQVLLHAMDQLLGREVSFLRELGNTMRHKVRLHDVLVTVSESSLRIQEAARLSYLACSEHSVQRDILGLREEVKVLTEALLQVADVLSVSPVSATNLSIRAELLQRELAVRVKALLLHLTSTNKEYIRAIQNVLTLALPPAPAQGVMAQQAFEKCAGQIMANVQLVRTVLEAALENTAHRKAWESLRSLTDHLLLLTAEVLGRAGERLRSQQDQELVQPDHTLWEWATKAHYLVTQLQSVPDVDKATLALVTKCLQTSEPQTVSNCGQGKAALSLPQAPSAKHQNLPCDATATEAGPSKGSLAETTLLSDSPKRAHSIRSEPCQGAAQLALADNAGKLQDDGNKMSQVTREMATGVSHMAQFLKRKGPITTKEQLVACARQMASNGRVFVKFGHMIAKNCLDERCATELLCVTEQIQTISNQLRMMSRVRAATAGSKCAAELLVTNAEHLCHVVLRSLKAAEAACVKGLQKPDPDSEEAEAAAFCIQWRKQLLWHRVKEALNPIRDDLGLRKTRARLEPTLTALAQEPSEQDKLFPWLPNSKPVEQQIIVAVAAQEQVVASVIGPPTLAGNDITDGEGQ